MSDGLLAILAFGLVIIAAIGTDTGTVDRKEDAYRLEMGVPHCVVFDYDCDLVKGDGSDG